MAQMWSALNSPLSPYSVGLITTSYSLLQPLRKHRTLLRLNALAKIVAFLNCNSVKDSASPSRLGSALTVGATSAAAFTEWFRQSCPVPGSARRDLLDPSPSGGLYRGAWTTEAFQKNVYLGEKTLTELSYFHVLIYFFFICLFFLVKTISGHPCGHHVGRWILRQWLSFPERHVSRVLCRYSNSAAITFPSCFHSLFSLKWHERQSY